MGVDLALLPVEGLLSGLPCAFSVLELTRCRELWDAINVVKNRPVGPTLRCYVATLENGERGWGNLEEDAYGNEIRYAKAGELAKAIDGFNEVARDHGSYTSNAPAAAYLRELPKDAPVALYWH
jgi:hypothetical protein